MGRVGARLIYPALILLAFAALVVVVNPFHDFPVQDDWDYARTVSILLRTGAFERSQIAQASEITSALWGALFAALFGFSFNVLRISTLVLSANALLICFAILGELGFDHTRRLLGVLTLLVAPLFVFLSFTFMTDVPMLCCLLGATYFYLRALRTMDARLAVAASICVALAFLTRQVGIVVAFAAALTFALHAPPAKRLALTSASIALPCMVALAYLLWLTSSNGVTWANSQMTVRDTLAFIADPQLPATVLRRIAADLTTIAFYLAPLALLVLPAFVHTLKRPTRTRLIVGAVLATTYVATIARLALRGEWLPYLTDAFTRAGLRPYLGYFAYAQGSFRAEILPLGLWIALTVSASALGCWLLWLLIIQAKHSPAMGFVYLTLLALALPTLLFREFYERFLLPFIPLAIIVLLDATRDMRLSPRVALVGVAAMLLFALLLMKDYWGWMDARWSVAQQIVSEGVPLEKLDAGYEWDGWMLYDKSIQRIEREHLPMQITPWAYVIDPEFLFAFTPLPSYHVVRAITFDSPFGARANRFYVLQRD